MYPFECTSNDLNVWLVSFGELDVWGWLCNIWDFLSDFDYVQLRYFVITIIRNLHKCSLQKIIFLKIGHFPYQLLPLYVFKWIKSKLKCNQLPPKKNIEWAYSQVNNLDSTAKTINISQSSIHASRLGVLTHSRPNLRDEVRLIFPAAHSSLADITSISIASETAITKASKNRRLPAKAGAGNRG